MKGAILFFTALWGGGWMLHNFGREPFPGVPILITSIIFGIQGAWIAIDEMCNRGRNK